MPATIAPPPPAKPASAPATLPPPARAGAAPPSAPAPPPEKPPESFLGDIGDELREMDSASGDSPNPNIPRRGADGKFTKPGEKDDEQPGTKPEKPGTKPEETETKPPEEEKKPLGPFATVRKAKEALEKERDEVFRPKIQQLESKVQEYERTLTELKTKQPDSKPWQDKVTALEKQNASLLEIVRYADYRKSPEFTDKYEKPYNEAWAKAVSEVTQLNLEMEDGSGRKATANDLLALANAPLDQLDDLASKWFPKSSARVIRHVEKIRDLAEAQDKALADAKNGAGEFEKKRTEEAQKQNGAFAAAYSGANTELTTKYPKWFSPDETDPAGNEILKKGFEYADTVFGANGNLTPEQKAGRLAVIRAKAAAFDREVSRRKAAQKRIDELEASLAEYEESAPPTEKGGEPGSIKPGTFMNSVEDELRKMDRR